MHSSGTRPICPSSNVGNGNGIGNPLQESHSSHKHESRTRLRKSSHDHRISSDTDNYSTPNAQRKRDELQNVPTRRVQHNRSQSALSSRATQQSLPRQHLATHEEAEENVYIEPDFILEERQAWSRKSPLSKGDSGRFYVNKNVSQRTSPQPRSYPPKAKLTAQTNASDHQRQEELQHPPVLKTFGPSKNRTNLEERPKTSRGLEVTTTKSDGASHKAGDEIHASKDIAATQVRRSKFLEGSMNARSKGVASAWDENSLLSEHSNNATLIATGASSDNDDLKAPPTTPSTIKRGLFRFGNTNTRSSEDSERSTEEMPKKTRSGLRKTLSTWNFHNLGDKIKRFGGSSNDLTTKPLAKKKNDNFTDAVDLRLLDERKRKAEEVYAQEFGSKRRRSNQNLSEAATAPQQEQKQAMKPRSVKRRSLSHSGSHDSLTRSRRNRRASSSITPNMSEYYSSSSDIDRRKKPSRKDLEKENQQLKAMLRESRSMNFTSHARASRSSVHLPLEEKQDTLGNGIRNGQKKFAQGHRVTVTPGNRNGSRHEDIPPVPKIPREVLGGLHNLHGGSMSGIPALDEQSIAMARSKLPRPVSSIMELDENDNMDNALVENADSKESRQEERKFDNGNMINAKEPWDWPDDVF